MSANIFSSLNGSYNYVNDMSNILSDYSSIKSGAYGSLLKSYVKKVGNKNALDAYRTTGSTTTAVDSATSTTETTKKTRNTKSSFVDNLGRGTSTSSSISSEEKASETTVTADKYAKYKSSWLDDQLKQYDKDANKTTAADTSVGLDTTI